MPNGDPLAVRVGPGWLYIAPLESTEPADLTVFQSDYNDQDNNVLDVAAGSGNAAIPAAMMGAKVVASDLTPELFEAGRGGRYTYHGPGQRVGYVLVDLERRGRDVRRFVHALEDWVISALAALGVAARRTPGRIGIWVDHDGREAKVGAIGVRVRRWVTMHGFAVNLAPKLSHFSGIVPCGIADFPVTSLDEMGMTDVQSRFDLALRDGLEGFLASLEGRQGRVESRFHCV